MLIKKELMLNGMCHRKFQVSVNALEIRVSLFRDLSSLVSRRIIIIIIILF